jgi:subtilisin family serine protease
MVVTLHRRRGRRAACAAVVLGLMVTTATMADGATAGAPRAAGAGTRTATTAYIVQLAEPPAVAYDGGLQGLPATAPAPGQRINPNSSAVRQYRSFLQRRHDDALTAAGASTRAKFYDYDISFNGFAATLTPAQAAKLQAQPGVVSVQPDELHYPMTDNSPDFLNIDGENELWAQLGGQRNAGEDVIIGVIDTGIWPEHPSFSDQTDLADRPGASGKNTLAYGPPPSDWHGICQSGEQWSKDDCNNKLIGARYFLRGLDHFGLAPDYASARDRDGHGTHTASTAGGNANVDPAIFGRDLGVETISGMAPRARIAAYKACFGPTGCAFSDLVASIDTAVADGVDVINYSIGSDTPELLGADDIAFLNATTRGNVFVATSAGNSGPGASTIGSPSADPWVITVGASTQSRYFLSTIDFGGIDPITGGSVGPPLDDHPYRLVDGEKECDDGTFAEQNVVGAIVLCEREVGVARLSHSAAVAAAGGAGMILYDPPQPSVRPTDNHYVPTVHVYPDEGDVIAEYIETAGSDATATFSGGLAGANPDGPPDMAGFSSRGPNGAAPDIIKPDVTAPGVQILAGASPTPWLGAPDQLFQAIQGTSMSSPHVAGIGALLRQAHPTWTPAMVKSALMTTAYQDVGKEDFTTPADPFDMGAGHIAPTPASDPGLVYDTTRSQYVDFICGLHLIECPPANVVDPSNLNLPSIGVAELAGVQTVTRTVTNVGPAGSYTVSYEAPPGVAVSVSPTTLDLAANASATYEVTFTTLDGAAFDEWTFGSLTWSDGVHDVRSPLAIKPVALSAPDEVSGTGTEGEITYDVTFGYTGDFNATSAGLQQATVRTDTVVDDPANDIDVATETGLGINEYVFTIPDDTRHFRASLFDEHTDGEDDLDLYLYDPEGNLVTLSGSATSAEQIDVVAPVGGDWTLVVHGWQTDGPDAVFDLFTWILPDPTAPTAALAVTAPTSAVTGATGEVTVAWTGLTAGTRYLGAVVYDDGTNEISSTLVSVVA